MPLDQALEFIATEEPVAEWLWQQLGVGPERQIGP
jgi:hypothetical protein